MAGRKMKTRQGLIATVTRNHSKRVRISRGWTDPGYARILRAGVVSIQMLMAGYIVKTRNTEHEPRQAEKWRAEK
jgi:hypothetical protein